MKFKLHNEHLINGDAQRKLVLQTLNENLNFFRKLEEGANYSLDVYLSESGNPNSIIVSLYLNYKGNQLYVDGEGDHVPDLVNDLLIRLKSMYLRKSFRYQKEKRLEAVETHVDKLQGLKHAGDKTQFGFLIKRLTPAIKGYVIQYISHKNRKLDPAWTIEDIVDEIYLTLFEKFDEKPLNDQEFAAWSYKIAREAIDSLIDKNKLKIENATLRKLTEKELSTLEEKYTTDAEGEFVMLEELDDISYEGSRNREESFSTTTLPEQPGNAEINEALKSILENTTNEKRTVFKLYWFNELTEKEIASAMDMPLHTVENIIDTITGEIIEHQK